MCSIFTYFGEKQDDEAVKISFDSLAPRGPDNSSLLALDGFGWIGFHRLAIHDTSSKGNQPFFGSRSRLLICNGEIYNHRSLRTELLPAHQFASVSDCEVLMPLIDKESFSKALPKLDAEFALVYFDGKVFCAARDPMGIRPLFFGLDSNGCVVGFASEAKALDLLCVEVKPFPPGHYYDGEFRSFCDLSRRRTQYERTLPVIKKNIRDHLVDAVSKRLSADVPVGFLLSGGLDSSLVCAIGARKLASPIKTFAIGTEHDAIDLGYARQVADYIGSEHTEVHFDPKKTIDILPKLIRCLETWDVTTIRASLGMYLLCQDIRRTSEVKVLLTGEVSDELFGYKYTDYAPSAEAFQEESRKRIRELYLYDVLRADRCISAHGLEARVPFGDKAFVEIVMNIHPEIKMNRSEVGKRLLREAFADGEWLPQNILWREKAAFSDAVGHSMVDELKAEAERIYSDDEFRIKSNQISNCPPISKEALLYRELFDSIFPGRSGWIPSYWMPNKNWEHCDVADPSARALPNYGASGN